MAFNSTHAGELVKSAKSQLTSALDFDEQWYLGSYPDVDEAVRSGIFASGHEHFKEFGAEEGRFPNQSSLQKFKSAHQQNSGCRYLAPTSLRVIEAAPKRIALVGSCAIEAWNLPSTLDGKCIVDIFNVNNLSPLPVLSQEEVASYDLCVVQIPLRAIMYTDMFWNIKYSDIESHNILFEDAIDRIRMLTDLWLAWNKQYGICTLVTNFMVPQSNPMGRFLPRYDLRNPQYFVEQLNVHLERAVRQYKNAFLFDIDRISASIGRRHIQDDAVYSDSHNGVMPGRESSPGRIEAIPSLETSYDLRAQTHLPLIIWEEISAAFRTARQIDAIKLVAVDLDDTLWRGISGELPEVDPNQMMEGWPHGIVEALTWLKKRGILLAILSKNEESRIRGIFDKLIGPRFGLEHFAAVFINWNRKTENMEQLLRVTNLLPNNILFIDDNPVERADMQLRFPEMRVLGQFPYFLRRELLWSAELQCAHLTSEGEARTDMLQNQVIREHSRGVLTREQFLNRAAPRLQLSQISSSDDPRFERIIELINKTNQFNTNGRRWKFEQLIEFTTNGGHIFVFDVADSYSDYGLVGIVLVDQARIVQWVMSCRVLGLGVERAVMAQIVEVIRDRGFATVFASVVETAVNFPCRSLFADSGFVRDGDEWVLEPSIFVETPEYVAIKYSR